MNALYDAIVLAGDRRDSHSVFGENKAFLEIAGCPLLGHVLRALDRSPSVGRAILVGDPKRLAEAVRRAGPDLRVRVELVAQGEGLWENFWAGYLATLSPTARARIASGERPEDAVTPEERDRYVLALSGDIPLIHPGEIEGFLAGATALGADYVAGCTPEASLEPFYPGPDAPGIKMAYFQLREGRFRQNNLHLVRPLRVACRDRIERLYRHRYQRRIRNAVRMAMEIRRTRAVGLSIVWGYVLLHVALKLDLRGWRRTSDFIRRFLPMARVEWAVSRMLGGSFRMACLPAPGAALDIDQEADYDALKTRFDEWRQRVAEGASAAPS
ncbi:MAG: hypothetical protein A2Y95_08470 [Deltaproteobacteria bacterium RBG_13_65_10]|nr:MAG: hypothetical protein A2Y95_08470 [Deltaproteobacteria bacterium RBG_13_65_10]